MTKTETLYSMEDCRMWIANGQTTRALSWLNEQEDSTQTRILIALCQKEYPLYYWEKALEALEHDAQQYNVVSTDLLLALGQGIHYSRTSYDRTRRIQYLQRAIEVADALHNDIEKIHWISVLANQYLRLGKIPIAKPLLMQSVQLSIQHQHHIVTIGQGMLLCGLWLQEGQLEQVASLCLQIEQASTHRENWIAFAAARNMRSSCWFLRKSLQNSVQLLLETGDILIEKGAVAALNLIKARLGELQLLIGHEEMLEIINSIKKEKDIPDILLEAPPDGPNYDGEYPFDVENMHEYSLPQEEESSFDAEEDSNETSDDFLID